MTAEVTIDRRRVLQGAAWATPTLLLATAVPAAAASAPVLGAPVLNGPVLGTPVLSSVTAYQDTNNLYGTALVTYMGDGSGPADYPITGVSLRIAVPIARVPAGTSVGTRTGTNWSTAVRTSDANFVYFTYTYSVALSEANPTTTLLSVVLPKTTDRTAFSITKRVNGSSNGLPVSVQSTPAVAAYSLLTAGATLAGVRDADGGLGWLGWLFGSARNLNVTSAVRNNSSSPTSNTAPVYGLVAKLSVPTAQVYAGATPTVTSGPWVYSSSAVSGSDTVFTLTHTGSPLNASTAITNANFRVRIQPFGSVPYGIGLSFEGRSGTATGAATTLAATAQVTA